MQRINIKCDKIKNQLSIRINYLLLYFCRLNTVKRTAEAPTVDLSRLNNLRRTTRKVMGGTEKDYGKEAVTEKKSWEEEVKEKMSCRVNCAVGLIALQTVFT